MVREVIQLLEPHRGEVYVDATVGLGGHAQEILRHMGGKALLVGTDRDEEALGQAGRILADKRCVLRKARFSELKEVLTDMGVRAVDGVLFDFGASMLQMKQPERGFGFASEEPLDMRMDRSQPLTAGEIVNTSPAAEIERILREYGEERASKKISGAILRRRQKQEIRTCRELSEVVAGVAGRRGRTHPATRTFQALRIAVNDELNEIRRGLEASIGLLRSGGRLVAISYHSLEDRTVKVFMKDAKGKGLVRVLTKKPLTPGREEILRNPSARSAKLRAAEVL